MFFKKFLSGWSLFGVLLAFRLVQVIFIHSFIDPDEYWQSLEPAHALAFGYGELTWEWRERIRCWLYPWMLSFSFRIAQFLKLEPIAGPKAFFALNCTLIDYFTFKLAQSNTADSIYWTLFFTLSSWFHSVYGLKGYSNTPETLLVTAFFLYSRKNNFMGALFAGLACLIRTSAITHLLVPCFVIFIKSPFKTIFCYSLAAFLTILLGFLLDTYFYRRETFSWLNFVNVNVFCGIASHFGVNPWWYYFVAGLATLCGITYPLALMSFERMHPFVLYIFASTALNSLTPHKEFRFIYPILPLIHVLLSARMNSFKNKNFKFLLATIILIGNLAMFYAFGVCFQRGAIDVTNFLGSNAPINARILSLMPCHSLPGQTHLHRPDLNIISLSCEPAPYRSANWKSFNEELLIDEQKLKKTLVSNSFDMIVTYEDFYKARKQLLYSLGYDKIDINVWNWSFDPRRSSNILVISKAK